MIINSCPICNNVLQINKSQFSIYCKNKKNHWFDLEFYKNQLLYCKIVVYKPKTRSLVIDVNKKKFQIYGDIFNKSDILYDINLLKLNNLKKSTIEKFLNDFCENQIFQ